MVLIVHISLIFRIADLARPDVSMEVFFVCAPLFEGREGDGEVASGGTAVGVGIKRHLAQLAVWTRSVSKPRKVGKDAYKPKRPMR